MTAHHWRRESYTYVLVRDDRIEIPIATLQHEAEREAQFARLRDKRGVTDAEIESLAILLGVRCDGSRRQRHLSGIARALRGWAERQR